MPIDLVPSLGIGLYFLLRVDYRFIILILVFTLPLIIITKLSESSLSKSQKKILNNLRNIIKKIKNYSSCTTIIKNFNYLNNLQMDFRKVNLSHANSVKSKENLNNVINEINSILGLGLFVGIYILGVYLILKRDISVGTLIFVIQTSNTVVNPIFSITPIMNSINSTKSIREKIEKILDYRVIKNKEIEKINRIGISNLSYSYEEKRVLNNINFSFDKGRKYLITGESGSGKSTLFKLVTSQLKGYKGSIEVDSIEKGSMSSQNYSSMFSVSSQVPEYFETSIKDNIIMNYKYNEKKFFKVIENLGLIELIESLEDGIDTILSSELLNLSGGQLQRISIARALYSEKEFLFLDEPFSALDDLNTKRVQDTLLDSEKTVVIISHKISNEVQKRYHEVIKLKNKAG